jgi:hypothetical protein
MECFMNQKLFDDFRQFCDPYIRCSDIDPVYPVLKKVHELRGLDPKGNEAIWHTFLYFVWYHLGSAETVRSQYPRIGYNLKLGKLDTGIERRGFRGEVGAVKACLLIDHVVGYLNAWFLSFDDFLQSCTTWQAMFNAVMLFPQCGTWAAYKWCDLMKNIHGYLISAPNIGYGGGGEHAGPIPGMVQLTGENWKECAFNINLQQELYQICLDAGIPFNGMEQMETALCDFNSMTHGRYYIGHDIDKQMENVTTAGEIYWKARSHVFPEWALGECRGYYGVRKNLLTFYQRTGKIFVPSEKV